MKPAVFLDRDGTINREVNYLATSSDLEVLPGVLDALSELAGHYPLIVVTNQSGIARGYLTEATLGLIHTHLLELLAPVKIDAIYYCPHHPEVGSEKYRQICDCRKPSAGMLMQAAKELDIDLSRSVVVGDKMSDLAAGRQVGCKTVLVLTGYGKEELSYFDSTGWKPDLIAASLAEAAKWIIRLKEET